MIFTILNLERNTDGGVLVAHWRVKKTSGDNVAGSYGTVSFTPDTTADGFVPFDSLTEEIVIGWVQASLDTVAIEAKLDADLAEQQSPTILYGKPF